MTPTGKQRKFKKMSQVTNFMCLQVERKMKVQVKQLEDLKESDKVKGVVDRITECH